MSLLKEGSKEQQASVRQQVGEQRWDDDVLDEDVEFFDDDLDLDDEVDVGEVEDLQTDLFEDDVPTQQELEALAKMDISSANKGLARAIADARMELRRNRNDGDRQARQQAGIPSVVPPPVTTPSIPEKPIVPFPPFMPTLPFPPQLVQGAPLSIYSNFHQFNLSTYAQRGIADPNLSSYYQNLGRIA